LCERAGAPVAQEETMSPLLIVQGAEDFEHALALCNGVRHGLAAALFGGQPSERRRFLDGARAGILKFDQPTTGVSARLPFGGWKASGIGPPEHGDADALFFTRWQTVYGEPGS
jgi:acyl-CoA reductase-like NAD-dependent aldehyde dehydrogenase